MGRDCTNLATAQESRRTPRQRNGQHPNNLLDAEKDAGYKRTV
jgi:hypothetical protein